MLEGSPEKYKPRRVEQSFWDDLTRGRRYAYGEGGLEYSVSDILAGAKRYRGRTLVGGYQPEYPMSEYTNITGPDDLTVKEQTILEKDFDY